MVFLGLRANSKFAPKFDIALYAFHADFPGKVKVKCTLVQALRLCTGRTAYRRSRGIALPFHDHGTRKRLGVSVAPRPLLTPGKEQVPIVQEAGWAPGPVWTGAVAQWLRCSATNRKVAGSIPVGVIGIFH